MIKFIQDLDPKKLLRSLASWVIAFIAGETAQIKSPNLCFLWFSYGFLTLWFSLVDDIPMTKDPHPITVNPP